MSSEAYAGIRRRKQTPWRVKFGDALVSRLITIGGIGTIGAVLLVVLVLLATAWPLLKSPTATAWHAVVPPPTKQSRLTQPTLSSKAYWLPEATSSPN